MSNLKDKQLFKILLVDDDPTQLIIMHKFIAKANPLASVIVSTNVDDAINKLSNGNFSIVVCDLNLPDKNGNILLEWMRDRVSYSKVPFIMISSNDDSEEIIHAFMKFGVDAYVTKPLDAINLYDKIMDAYNKRQQSFFRKMLA